MTNRLKSYDFEWIGFWLMLSALGGSAFGAGWIANLLMQRQAPWHQVGQLFGLFGFLGGVVAFFVGFWVVAVGIVVGHAQTLQGLKTIARFTPDARVNGSKQSYKVERKMLPLNTWAFPLLLVTAGLLISTDYFLYTGVRNPYWNINAAKCVAAWICSTTAFLTFALATPVSLSEYMSPKRGTRSYMGNEANSHNGRYLNFQGDDLSHANLSNAQLHDANLENAILVNANLSHADLENASLSDANLSGANLSDADLGGANLAGADLCDANLNWTNLNGANLTNAYLPSANLENVNLSGADLTNAYLADANLENANLSGADLTNAYLARANLENANLENANLIGATCPNGIVHGNPGADC